MKTDSQVRERIERLMRCYVLNFHQSGQMSALTALKHGMGEGAVRERLARLKACSYDDGQKAGEISILEWYLKED
jgi:hypothetical protein